jgi:hypothetical protein
MIINHVFFSYRCLLKSLNELDMFFVLYFWRDHRIQSVTGSITCAHTGDALWVPRWWTGWSSRGQLFTHVIKPSGCGKLCLKRESLYMVSLDHLNTYYCERRDYLSLTFSTIYTMWRDAGLLGMLAINYLEFDVPSIP